MTKSSVFLVCVVAAALSAFAALPLPLPYGFYMFLRLAVSVSAGIWCWSAFSEQKAITGEVLIAGALVLLFNPIVPVHFGRGIWMVLDAIAAVAFGVKAFRTRP